MKIAMVGSRGYPGYAGGVEKSLEELCPRLAAMGHEVTVYCASGVNCDEDMIGGVRLRRIPALATKHLETISRSTLAGLDLLPQKYDIVHYHSIGSAVISWMTRLKRSKHFVTVHGLDWQRAKWGVPARLFLKLGERMAAWIPDRTVVVSKFLTRHYRDCYGKEAVFIPNGATLYEPRAPKLISSKWGLERGSYVLFASRLTPEKGCHVLIEAFRKLKTDKRLVIAGASWHTDAYAQRLREAASGADNILFTGWVDGEALKELYSNAYVFCLPSEIEGLSLSLLESMGCNVCPLVSDITENLDVIEEHGVSFRLNDMADLTQKLDGLLKDPNLVQRLGLSAGNMVRDHYTWEKAAVLLEQAYREALSQEKG